MNRRTYLILGVIGILAAGVGLYAFRDSLQGVFAGIGEQSTTTPNGIPVPSLRKKLVFPETMPREVREDIQEKVAGIIKGIKEKPQSSAPLWNELGLYYQLAGDYESAREAWEYASALVPSFAPPYNNLANLYAYKLTDYEKAEKNFRLAIQWDPTFSDNYHQAYSFYLYQLKDPAKAKAVLQAGVKANPQDAGLKEALAKHGK